MKILMFHHILPDSPWFHSLRYLREESFLRLLDWLGTQGTILDNGAIRETLSGSHCKQTDIILTFDDNLASHEWAADVLRARGLGAIFFIPTGAGLSNANVLHFAQGMNPHKKVLSIARGNDSFRVNYPIAGEDSPETLRRVVNHILPVQDEDAVCSELKLLVPECYQAGASIPKLSRNGFICGNHTMRHRDPTKLSQAELEHEVRQGGSKVFSYPFGIASGYPELLPRLGITSGFLASGGEADRISLMTPRIDCNEVPYGYSNGSR